MASNARFFPTVCKSDASAPSDEPQRKDRSSCSFFNYRECSCPHGPAMIEISLISFRRLKLENPLQFSLLRSSFLPPSLPPLSPTRTLLEVRIETERGIKDETPGRRFVSGANPTAGLTEPVDSTRELVWQATVAVFASIIKRSDGFHDRFWENSQRVALFEVGSADYYRLIRCVQRAHK